MEATTDNCKEAILFNSDTLSKVISFLPSLDLLNLALTSKRFGISDDEKLSVIKMSADILVHEIATEEQLAALPHYEGESSLADYHYLQLMREPLMFDQLVDAVYVNTDADKSCVKNRSKCTASNAWGTTFSNNIMRAGKHYVTFDVYQRHQSYKILTGIMRPGQANENAHVTPINKKFYQHFSRRLVHGEYNNSNIHCCLYYYYRHCLSSDWGDGSDDNFVSDNDWEGMESMSSSDEMGMLLNLDEGTLSVYKNGRKLGIMKRGLAGPYCWVASFQYSQVTIKRGSIPP